MTDTEIHDLEARKLEAEPCRQLANRTEPFVSRSLSFRLSRLSRAGKARWSQAPDGLDALESGIERAAGSAS